MNKTVNVVATIELATITTTEDRIRNAVRKYNEKRRKDWKSTLSFLIPIALAFCGCDWRNAFGIPWVYWYFGWLGCAAVCLVHLVYVLIYNYRHPEDELMDELINDLKME